MPRPRDAARAAQIGSALQQFSSSIHPLPGIRRPRRAEVLIEQILESIHRVDYVSRVRGRSLSPNRQDPNSDAFDPLKAAILHQDAEEIDDAFWMVFLFVHFGKNLRTGWRLARDVYGALGGKAWTWDRVSRDPNRFRQWLASNLLTLQGRDGVARHFGNHRKYQSLDPASDNGTGAAVETYVAWVGPTRNHRARTEESLGRCGADPRTTFDDLYRSMRAVRSFGRTARFDYLTMVGKLKLAPIEPGSTYMQGSTGPLSGARLLFGDTKKRITRTELDAQLVRLGQHTGLGMQVLEDSLCNWQKSPNRLVRFRG